MKNILLICVAVFVTSVCNGQNNFLGHYSYTMEQPIGDERDELSSRFSYDLWFSQEKVWIEKEPAIANFPSLTKLLSEKGLDTTSFKKSLPGSGVVYSDYNSYDLSSNIFKTIRRWDKSQNQESYVVVDTLPDIDWVLTDEYKKIDSFNCQKAIGHFRGRTYFAWYAKEIPIPAGPWKLHGLPGLILEAVDSLGKFKFSLRSLTIPAIKKADVIDFSQFNNYSRTTYAKKVSKDAENLNLFLKSMGGGEEAIRSKEESFKKNKPWPIELF